MGHEKVDTPKQKKQSQLNRAAGERPFAQAQPASTASRDLQTGIGRAKRARVLQRRAGNGRVAHQLNQAPIQRQSNGTGLPDQLKSGVEALSGYAMDDVNVHYNSPKPAQLQAHAYAQGTDIHIAPGQEKHLPHEAWHVVQQKQGRVHPTTQAKGIGINDERSLEREATLMGNKALALNSPNRPLSGTPSLKSSIQHPSPIQREPWDAAKNIAETNLAAHLNMAPGAHPTQVGAQQDPLNPGQTAATERHFNPGMLDFLQDILDGLPDAHIKGNPSLARIVMKEDPGGGASYYQPATNSLNIVVPFDSSEWLYMKVGKWPIGELGVTVLGEIDELQTQWGLLSRAEAIKRIILFPWEILTRDSLSTGSIADKVSGALSTESFLEMIVRHETGHAVDQAIGWSANRHYRLAPCGGWEKYLTPPNRLLMTTQILNAVGINDGVLANLNLAFNPHTGGNGYRSLLNAVNTRDASHLKPAFRAAALAVFEGTNPGGTNLVNFAEEAIRVGLTRPWEKGGGVDIGGRTYQLDNQQSEWVSYISNKYALRNSNYQYSNPDEWFAEVYHHYFRPPQATWGQRVRDPAARAWFNAHLDPNGGGAVLINALGNLTPLGPAPPMQPAPAAGSAVPPSRIRKIAKQIKDLTVNIAKIPISAVLGTITPVVSIMKKIPPVNWALRWLGF